MSYNKNYDSNKPNGLKVGQSVRVNFYKEGKKGDYVWRSFVYNDAKKDKETGEYKTFMNYTIFLSNNVEGIQNGDTLIIKSIDKVNINDYTSNGIQYRNFVLNCCVEKPKPKEQNSDENPFVNENEYNGGVIDDISEMQISPDDIIFD